MLSHKPSITPRFDIHFPNNNRIYTTQMNQIKGQVKLKFNKKCKNITNVEIGFKGDVRSRHLRKENVSNSIYSKVDVIFNQSHTLLSSRFKKHSIDIPRRDKSVLSYEVNRSSVTGVTTGGAPSVESMAPLTFPHGYILDYPFHFQFPSDHYELPSSCDSLCSRIPSSRDNITVRYEVYVRVTYITKRDTKYMDFLVPLMFQGDSLSLDALLYNDAMILPTFHGSGLIPSERPPSSLIAEAVTMDKLKVYSPDIELGGLKLNEPTVRRSGSLIKKLKHKLTKKKSNPMLLSNNVTLAMIIEVPAVFNLASDLADLPISFVSTSHFAPLELQYNGMSTTLGLFDVDSIKVSIVQHLMLNGTNYDNKRLIYKSVFKESKRPSVDIKDFQFDREHGEYIFKTNLGYLIDDPTPLFDNLKKPFMQNCTIADYLICENSLQISLTLSTKNTTTTTTTVSTPDTTPTKPNFNHPSTNPTFHQAEEIKKCRLSAATKIQCNFSNSQIMKYEKTNHKSATFHYNRHYVKSKPRANKGTGGLLQSEKFEYLGKGTGGSVIAGILAADENDELMDHMNCGYYENCCYDSGDGYQTVGQDYININEIVDGIISNRTKRIAKKLIDDGFGVLGDYCWFGFGVDGKCGGFARETSWFRC